MMWLIRTSLTVAAINPCFFFLKGALGLVAISVALIQFKIHYVAVWYLHVTHVADIVSVNNLRSKYPCPWNTDLWQSVLALYRKIPWCRQAVAKSAKKVESWARCSVRASSESVSQPVTDLPSGRPVAGLLSL